MPSFQDDIMREFDQGVADIEGARKKRKPLAPDIEPATEDRDPIANLFDAGVKEIEQVRIKEPPSLPVVSRATPFSDLKPIKEGSTLGAFARTVGRVPENLAAKAIMAVQGQAGASVADKDIADRFVGWVEKRNRQLAESYEKTGDFIPGFISKKDVAELGPNLAFSGVSMAGTIGGAAAAAPIPVPGARVAGAMAGGATAAYRMDSYQAMDSWLKKRNEESIKLFGRPISTEEETKFKKEFNELATEHGLWEAGPEAIGNVLDLAFMTAKNITPAGRLIPGGLPGKVIKGAMRMGGILATEEATETITQMGQKRVEAEVEGGPKPKWTSGEDWLKSAKEVLPQVIMLTGVMGAGGAAYHKATQKEGDAAGKLKQQILNSIIEVYEKGEQTGEQVAASITEGYKGGMFDEVDLKELSKKYPDLKDKIEVGRMTAKGELVNEQLTAAIDEGMATGVLQGEVFRDSEAVDFIRQGLAEDIFATEDIESFKEKYPALRGALNALTVEDVATDLDLEFEPVTEPVAEPAVEKPKVYAIQDIENIYLKAKERVRIEPISLQEIQERFKERQGREASAKENEELKRIYEKAKLRSQRRKIFEERRKEKIAPPKTKEELELEAYEPALPPGAKEVRLKKGERTYPRGAEFVAGKPAPEELKVEYKPVLKKVGKKEVPWLTLNGARNALESDKMKDRDVSPATHKVVEALGGYQIVPIKAKGPALVREVKKEVKGRTLLSWVRTMGGVSDSTLPGEVRALSAKEAGVVGLIGKEGKGLGFDEMAAAAVEEGWIEKPEDFAETLRDDIFAQKEGKPRTERLADVAARTERGERWKEFDRSEEDMLRYFAEHPDEEIATDLDKWQREAITDIRSRDAERAKEIEESTRREVEEKDPDLEGLKEDEGFSEFIEGWDEREALDEEALAELEVWRAEKKEEPVELEIKKEELTLTELEIKFEKASKAYRRAQDMRGVGATGQTKETQKLWDKQEALKKQIRDKKAPAEKAAFEKLEEEAKEKREAWATARDKAVAEAPVFRKVNEWEIVKHEGDYYVRNPYTKEEIYRSPGYKRASEVAKEEKPEHVEPEAPKLIETKYRKRPEELKAEMAKKKVKAEPVVISEEDYLAQKGAGRQTMGEAALHKNIRGAEKERAIKRQAEKDRALIAKRDELREEYKAKIKAGEIRKPTRIEALIETAKGHPDVEATQAARRLLEKRGIEWDKPGIEWDKPGVKFSVQAPMYSALTRAAEAPKLPAKLPAKSVINQLKKAAGVKQVEIEVSGLAEWLEGKDKVLKTDLVDFLRMNEVRVEEVEKGGKYKISLEENLKKLQRGEITQEEYDRTNELIDLSEQTKFAEPKYRLPGGEPGTYRELVLRVPLEPTERRVKVFRDGKVVAEFDEYMGAVRYTEKHGKAEHTIIDSLEADKKEIYTTSHWDEPNVIAHIRGDARTDADGKRRFHVAEFQSDIYSRIVELEQAGGNQWEIYDKKTGEQVDQFSVKEGEELEKYVDADILSGKDEKYGVRNVPSEELANLKKLFPWGEMWHELVAKKALEYAVRNDFDGISWDTAKTQVDRWESALRKSVDEIGWIKRGQKVAINGKRDGHYIFDEIIPLYGETTISGQRVTLNNLIGKELATKIRESSETSGNFEGKDLTIGGEFYKIIYDQKIPGFLKKYGKKWGVAVSVSRIVAMDEVTAKLKYTGPERTIEEVEKVLDVANRLDEPGIWESPLTGERQTFRVNSESIRDEISLLLKDMKRGLSFSDAMEERVDALDELFGGKLEKIAQEVPIHVMDITPTMKEAIQTSGQALFAERTAPGKKLTVDTAKAEIVERIGKKAIDAMMGAKKIQFVTLDEVAEIIGYIRESKDQGFYKDGVVYLIPENIGEGKAFAVLMHELGVHLGYNKIFGEKLAKEVFAAFVANKGKPTKLGKAVDEAIKRVESARVHPDFKNEEAVAYFAEENANIDLPLHRKIIARMRLWAVKYFGVKPDIFVMDDYVALAASAMRGEIKEARREPMRERVSEEVFYSQEDQREMSKFSVSEMPVEDAKEQVTDNPNFVKWFGDSKVVDKDGEPLVVYHGGLGADKIRVFDSRYQGDTTGNNPYGAFHFTDSKQVAEDYGRQAFIRRYQDSPEDLIEDGIIPEDTNFDEIDDVYEFVDELAEDYLEKQNVYLDIKNPIIIDMEGERVNIEQINKLTGFAKEGIDETGELWEKYYEQLYGEYDPADIEQYRTEIEESVRENYALKEDEKIEDYMFNEAAREIMEESGYEVEHTPIDGIIIKNMIDDIGELSAIVADQYIAFEPTQIKSIFNIGTFDPTRADIRYSVAEQKDLRAWADDLIKSAKDDSFVLDTKKTSPEEIRKTSMSILAGLDMKKLDQPARSFLQGMSPKGKGMGAFIEKWLASPEWYQHPVLKEIVGHSLNKSEKFHTLFNEFNAVDDPMARHDTVAKTLEALARKGGISKAAFILGRTSSDFKKLETLLDDADIYGEKHTVEGLKKKGYSKDVIQAWSVVRESYDKQLEARLKPMKDLVARIKEQAMFKGVDPKDIEYPDFGEYVIDGKKRRLNLKEATMYMGQLKGSYSPRIRNRGDWVVSGKKVGTVVEGGDDFFRDNRRTKSFANLLKDNLVKQGYTDVKVQRESRLPEETFQAVRLAEMGTVIGEAAKKGLDKYDVEMQMAFMDDIMLAASDTLKSRGSRAIMIRRRGGKAVRGYVTNPLIRFVRYTGNNASGIAKAEMAERMVKSLYGEYKDGKKVGGIYAAKEGEIHSLARAYIEEQLRNAEAGDRMVGIMKGLTTLKFLGFNPRSVLVNMSSLTTSVPMSLHTYIMAGKGSLLKIGKMLSVGCKDYTKVMAGRRLTNLDEQDFIDSFRDAGYTDAQYTRDAMGNIQGAYGTVWSKLMGGSMYVFGKSEEWVRGGTALTAFRLAKKQGLSNTEAKEKAILATAKAHGTYGKETLPMVAWGKGVGRLGQAFYTYMKFPHNYLQMLYDAGIRKKNIKGVVFGLAAPAVLGGVAAVPMYSTVMAIANALMSLIGDDRDAEKLVYDTINEHMGKDTEETIRGGVLGLVDLDISGSLSMGPGSIPTSLFELTGAVGGMVEDIYKGVGHIVEDEYGRAAEKLLPKAIGNIFTAVREIRGATTSRGDRIWNEQGQPYVPETSETIKRGLGFRSARRAILAQSTWVAKREERRFKETASSIYKKVKYLTGRSENVKLDQDVEDRISEYNTNALETANIPLITPASIERQLERMKTPTTKQKARVSASERVTRFEGDIWADALGVIDRPDSTQTEIKRLADLGILKYSAPPSRNINAGYGIEVKLDDDQYGRYVADTSAIIKLGVDRLMALPAWHGLSDKKKAFAVKRIINEGRKIVRDRLKITILRARLKNR